MHAVRTAPQFQYNVGCFSFLFIWRYKRGGVQSVMTELKQIFF